MRTRLALLTILLAAACEGGATDPDAGGPPASARDSVVSRTNAARAGAGIRSLAADRTLHDIAQAHARDMATRGYFSHVTPEGRTLTDRLQAGGAAYSRAGENIALNASAHGAVDAWLASSGHRANILDPAFGRIGVGVHRDPGRPVTYYVQIFTD